MKIAVLGDGPAGMFAAHAAISLGHDVRIFSGKKTYIIKSHRSLLQLPIPQAYGRGFTVDYQMIGRPEEFRAKGGRREDAVVSTESRWSLEQAFDVVNRLYGHLVLPWDESVDWIPETFDKIVSSVSAKSLCRDPSHEFEGDLVFFNYSAPSRLGDRDNIVLASGSSVQPWTVACRVEGAEYTEYPLSVLQDSPMATVFGDRAVHQDVVPKSTTCDCYPHIIRIGPLGRWDGGVSYDNGYYRTKKELS